MLRVRVSSSARSKGPSRRGLSSFRSSARRNRADDETHGPHPRALFGSQWDHEAQMMHHSGAWGQYQRAQSLWSATTVPRELAAGPDTTRVHRCSLASGRGGPAPAAPDDLRVRGAGGCHRGQRDEPCRRLVGSVLGDPRGERDPVTSPRNPSRAHRGLLAAEQIGAVPVQTCHPVQLLTGGRRVSASAWSQRDARGRWRAPRPDPRTAVRGGHQAGRSLSLRPTLRRPAVRSVRPSDCRWRSLGSPMTSKTTVLMPPDRARGPRGKLVD
jgi:hypothetical protein